MATLADIRTRVKQNLYSANPTESPFVSQLAASYLIGASSITVLDENQWEVNDIVENSETGEQLLVTAVSSDASDTLTVIRGWNGTTAAASDGSDDTILKNPRFTQKQIDQEIQNVLDDLEQLGIHTFAQGEITRADPKRFYEVTEGDVVEPYGVLHCYYVETNTEIPVPVPFRYYQKLGTNPTEYSGEGAGIHVLDWGNVADTEKVHFIYAQNLQNIASVSTRVEEIIVLGATANLLSETIIPATHDPGDRTDRTVQPGQTSRDWRHWQFRFENLARKEAALLTTERQRLIREPTKYSRIKRWRS